MADAKTIITEHNKQATGFFNSGDIKSMVGLMDDNIRLMVPKRDTIIGKQGAQKAFEGLQSAFAKSLKIDAEEIEGQGDSAFERGVYSISDAADVVQEHGKYVVVWKKIGSDYKIYIMCLSATEIKHSH